jgi:ribonuclease D
MIYMSTSVFYLDTQTTFDNAISPLKGSSWIGFDTEFIGERTYVPILCLLQIVTHEGDVFLVDTLKINDLSAFLDILSDPHTLKVTHAGDNDYRLLHTLFGVIPTNTFDTQIAAGFVGYNYPAGFGKIVERELRISLAKSHTVADWEARPLDPKALDYAVEDVKYLPALHKKLMSKLERAKRIEWAREENLKWEKAGFYVLDPYKEALSNDYLHQLDRREQVFQLRIYAWRRHRAAELNVPREQVVQTRHIMPIMRALRDGPGAFRANRTLPENAWKKYHQEWAGLWSASATETELQVLRNLPAPPPDDPIHEWNLELLYHFVKKQCLDHEISAALLLPRGDFNKLKNRHPDFDMTLLDGWRGNLLGPTLVQWLRSGTALKLGWSADQCVIS